MNFVKEGLTGSDTNFWAIRGHVCKSGHYAFVLHTNTKCIQYIKYITSYNTFNKNSVKSSL